jgi:hypothetical protein
MAVRTAGAIVRSAIGWTTEAPFGSGCDVVVGRIESKKPDSLRFHGGFIKTSCVPATIIR